MAGVSEVFNLEFKFGGNAEFLARLEALMQRVDARFDSVAEGAEQAASSTEEMADSVDDLNKSVNKGISSLGKFGEKIKEVAKYYLSFQAIKSGVERVWAFGMQSMEIRSVQERSENQLKGVLRNRGSLDQFQSIKDYAADIQSRSVYGDEALIKGAGELATYVKGTGALKSMMDLLTDYAAGMTGGGAVSADQMESLATGLGMAYDGNYMAMRKKGFDTSKLEAYDAIVESGGVWGEKQKKKYGDILDEDTVKLIKEVGGVTEQMRVNALKESLKDWKGLSDAVSNLDSSALIKFQNKLGDLREEVGERLYPVFNRLLSTIDTHMEDIGDIFNTLGDMFITFAEALEENMETIKNVVKLFANFLGILVQFPKATASVALGLKVMSSGALTARGSFGSLSTQLKMTLKDCMKLNAALALVAGVAIGTTGPGAETMENGGVGGTLATVGMAAMAGAAAFGALGAAAAAAAAAVVMAFNNVKDEYLAWQDLKESEKKREDRDADERKLLELQKATVNARRSGNVSKEASLRGDLAVAVEAHKKKYGENSIGTGIIATLAGGWDAYEKQKAEERLKLERESQLASKIEFNNTNNYTNIEQNVNLAADISKIGILLNQNIRSIIEKQLKQNREVSVTTGI